ncbi:MAG: lamin tail domain-containing protein [Paludibacter sp.]|nr:lamin tail domain-containing protein [Paludibacter sp.]
MKNSMLFFLFFTPFLCFAQVEEFFSDGNFTENPIWTGADSNFIVNSISQLQSAASASSTSFLFTPSESIEEASWECKFLINYTTSASNYACMYIISDRSTLVNGLRGYFVQVGGTNDEVSLYLQEGMQIVKIIDGVDKRTDGKPVEITVKVTRDSLSVFSLFSRLSTESDFFLEGTMQNNNVLKTKYFGLSFTNTSTTGNCYFFDDILVKGDKIIDTHPPELLSLNVSLPNTLTLGFSEVMNFSDFKIKINDESVSVLNKKIAQDLENLELMLDITFEKGVLYLVEITGLTDEAGNLLENNRKSFALAESISPNDVVFNEVMFNHPDSSFEYIELYNRSDKLIDLSGLIFTTRKSDGTLNSGNIIPKGVMMIPNSYLALTNNIEIVRKHHDCPLEANLVQSGWSALNNESATLVLTNASKDTIFDEFTYQASMHHVLIKNSKGVALERICADLPTQDLRNWHSAAFVHHYGTPGFKNSQFRTCNDVGAEVDRLFYLESQVFSPDNDGVDDLCMLKYELPEAGYVANIAVMTATGEKVFTIAANHVLAGEGFFFWDGRNQSGKISNIGIYVIYTEIFHPLNGIRKQIKIPVVLSSR